MGQLDFETAALRYRALPAQRRGLLWLALAGMAMLLLALGFRQPVADWFWPETRAHALRMQAGLALEQGRLSAADGSGARELYEAAIAIDPDRNEARSGLARVAQAALAQAGAALQRDDFAQAHRHLALARELAVPRAQADAFATRLRTREAGVAGIEGLLSQAEAARAQGRLDGAEDAALPLYQRVLSLQPERIRALEGREDALTELLQRAHRELQTGDLVQGSHTVAVARLYDPGHIDLPQAQGELTRAVERLRAQAERDLRRGALQRAATAYDQLRRIDPDDPAISRGQTALAQAHVARAEEAASDFDFAGAEASLRQARALDPESAAIDRAQAHLADARKTRARLLPGTGGRAAARGQATRVAQLLRDAAAAQARGDLLTPPGESAYDKLRAARALAPEDAAVRAAQSRLAPSARRCFERELPRNDLGRANACLDAWVTLEGQGAETRGARRRLAQRWLAVGAERLGAGELASASAALASAERLDGRAPGLDDFRERMRSATASGD